jgi:hypothetical protein
VAGHPSRADPKNTLDIVAYNGSDTVKVCRTTNLSAASPTWATLKTITTACYRAILFRPPPYAALLQASWLFIQTTNEYLSLHRTYDDWANTTTHVDIGFGHNNPLGCAVSAVPSAQNDGLVLVSNYGGAFNQQLKVSTNGGTTFPTTCGNFNSYYDAAFCSIPWIGNSAEQVFYAYGLTTAPLVLKTTNGGNTFADITPTYGGDSYGSIPNYGGEYLRETLYTWTPNPLKITAVLAHINHQETQRAFISDDGGATWTPGAELNAWPSTAPIIYGAYGWPYDVLKIFLLASDGLYYSADRLATLPEDAGWSAL